MSYIPGFKRLFWMIVLTACCIGASVILKSSLDLYSAAAVSYSVETNYLEWETPFPALTICEALNAERVKAHLIANKHPTSVTNFFKEVSYWNAKYCKTCSSCKENVTCLEDFVDSVRRYRLKCRQLLTVCWWNDQPFRCCDRFHQIETEYGTCFAYNSGLIANSTKTITLNRRTGLPGLVFTAVDTVFIRIHGPEDVVSVMMDNILATPASLPLVSDIEVILSAEQTVSDVSVKSLPPDIRGCLYKHERPAFAERWPFSKYSYSGCVLYCRAMAQFEHCNCTHHFMPKIAHIPACNIRGLYCLNINKESLAGSTCNCPMGCEEIFYKVVHKFFTRHSGKLPADLESRGTRGIVRLAHLPSLRVRRLAIRDTLGLVVDIGGVGGVFFGASLLSAFEVIYLLCIRRNR